MEKNIFDYAKKELSQDAFLMYIVDCYNSTNKIERDTSRRFIRFLVGLPEDEEITKIWMKPQWYKIDISIYFYTKNQIIAAFIEDKTTSEEHNQLKFYTDSIDGIISRDKNKPTSVKKIFYKTSTIRQDERKRIVDAGWEEIPFEKIYDFWKDFKNVDHMIIRQYAQHIESIFNDSNNTEIPKDNNTIAWLSFFQKVVEPAFNSKVICRSLQGRYNYAYIWFQPKGTDNKKMPYLEIRSRDCLDGTFNARILTYGVEYKDANANGLEELRQRIKEREEKGIFQGNYGKKRNKQVACTNKEKFKASSPKDFIDKANLVLEEYLDIVSVWK